MALSIQRLIKRYVGAFNIRHSLKNVVEFSTFDVGKHLHHMNLDKGYEFNNDAYFTVSKADWETIIRHDWTNQAKFDIRTQRCTNYARTFYARMPDLYGLNAVGFVRTDTHAFNWILFDDDTWSFFEPQDDRWIPDHEIGTSPYVMTGAAIWV